LPKIRQKIPAFPSTSKESCPERLGNAGLFLEKRGGAIGVEPATSTVSRQGTAKKERKLTIANKRNMLYFNTFAFLA